MWHKKSLTWKISCLRTLDIWYHLCFQWFSNFSTKLPMNVLNFFHSCLPSTLFIEFLVLHWSKRGLKPVDFHSSKSADFQFTFDVAKKYFTSMKKWKLRNYKKILRNFIMTILFSISWTCTKSFCRFFSSILRKGNPKFHHASFSRFPMTGFVYVYVGTLSLQTVDF